NSSSRNEVSFSPTRGNETRWLLAVRVSNPDYRLCSRGLWSRRRRPRLSKNERKPRSIYLVQLRIFVDAVHDRSCQPLSSPLSQLSSAMERELLLHSHLVCLNCFDTYIQFVRQLRSTQPSADKRENLQLTIAEAVDIRITKAFSAACEVV